MTDKNWHVYIRAGKIVFEVLDVGVSFLRFHMPPDGARELANEICRCAEQLEKAGESDDDT